MVEAGTDQISYKAQILSYSKRNGHIQYRIRIDAPNNITFHINDRYSNLRLIQSTIKKQLQGSMLRKVPNFPPKKLFGNTKEGFIDDRMHRLNNFWNQFLSIPAIASNEFVLVFFEQQVEVADTDKFKQLIEYLKSGSQGKPNSKQGVKTMNMGGNPNMIKIDHGDEEAQPARNIVVGNKDFNK
jgi:hypothetical protein